MKRFIMLNLKTYAESTGEAGERLCAIADEAAAEAARGKKGVEIIVCPQTPFIPKIVWALKHATVFAQACDAAEQGQSTGAVTPEALKEAGVAGTIVNHSERKLAVEQVREVAERCGKLGLRACACAASLEEGVALAGFSPWAVAVEPPELIGSGVSVSAAKPALVKDAVKKIREANKGVAALVGAGVSTPEDVAKCVELGADGVLLASSFVKARDPKQLLQEMVAELG